MTPRPARQRPLWRAGWLKLAAVAWAVLLLASSLTRILADSPPLPRGRSTTEIRIGAPGDSSAPPIRIAWRQWDGQDQRSDRKGARDLAEGETASDGTGADRSAGPDGGPRARAPDQDGDRDASPDPPAEPLPLLLLHGSPGSADDFRRLAPRLAEGRQVIAPDLPGFGASEHRVDDYSIRAHSDATLALLDELGIERFHVLGFSMGGGPALHLADDIPERVASVILVASIGVQELELLGNYTVNRGLHGLQLGLVWSLQNLVPHFGAFDHPVARAYARNFLDTDQRPLRGVLGELWMPVLIVHGEHDPLVPAAAALEHHRIVPHSELWMRPDSHFFLFRGDEDLAARLDGFLDRVETGAAATRGEAEPDRLRRAALPFAATDLPPFTGPALLIVCLLLVLASFISEDLTCITGALLVAQGRLDFPAAVAACYVGLLGSDVALAWLARVLGRPSLTLPPLKWWASERSIDDASAWLRQRALVVVLISRFLPGARLPTCLAAGILRTSLLRFFLYFALSAAIWTPAFVGLNVLLGRPALDRFGNVPGGLAIAVLGLALLIVATRSVVVPLFTWRGRRRLRGRILRLRHWEFWSMWAFYPPLLLYILWQGLRRGRLAFFTAINPCMPLGGLLGESKCDILDGLSGIGNALPAWRRLPPGSQDERLGILRRFLNDHDLDWPVVLKPDTGERGRGVAIARSEAEAAAFFDATPGLALAQEFLAGEEYGVFWARTPGERDGRVISITHKVRPSVTGDGVSTLEELILRDRRAVALARVYGREHPDAARRTPAAGEVVELTEVGAHSRGTIFLDANALHTPELEHAVNAISTAWEGFDFGRFDLRVPSAAALRRGEGIRVLELNGVTSEAAHMYDPANGFFAAHAILRQQWSLAFELAAERVRNGATPATAGEVLSAVLAERRARRVAHPQARRRDS